MDNKKHLEAGAAYEFLGLPEEAREEYAAIPSGSADYGYAQGEIVGALLTQRRYPEAWAHGLGVLKQCQPCQSLVVNTSLALHLDGHFAEALDLLLRNPSVLRAEENAIHIATSAARCGNWDWADKAFFYHMKHTQLPKAWFFLDRDVEIWLAHLLESSPSPERAEFIAYPRVADLWLTMPPPQHPVPVDGILAERIPRAFRPWLKVEPRTAHFAWDPSAPSRLRERYLRWQCARFQRNQRLLSAAVAQARQTLLDLQLEWAVAHARQGNFLAARYHLLYAIERDLRRFHDYEQALRPLGMAYLLDDILRACFEDPAILKKLGSIRAGLVAHSTPSRDLLDEMDAWHPRIRETGLFLIQRGHLLQDMNRQEEALATWLQLAQRWPDDPVGFHNAARLLALRNEWTQAEAVLQFLPSGANRILCVEELRQQIADRDMHKTAYILKETFYGQRNLGGILRMNDQPLKWIP